MFTFKEEKHTVVHKFINGEWKVNTYFPTETPEFKGAIEYYKSNPDLFLLNEVIVQVPITRKLELHLTEEKWEKACNQATVLSAPENKQLFNEVASVLKINLLKMAE